MTLRASLRSLVLILAAAPALPSAAVGEPSPEEAKPADARSPHDRGFTVYAAIPWHKHMERGVPVSKPGTEEYARTLGMHPVKILYHGAFLTADHKPDPGKIAAVAAATRGAEEVPVSFDAEFESCDRGISDAENAARNVEVLRLYRKAGGKAPVGVYCTAPQNSYGLLHNKSWLNRVNPIYAPVAREVDLLSPGLYNYDGADNETWAKAAVINMEQAKVYEGNKPILPYLCPVLPAKHVKPGQDAFLTEDQMYFRLKTLRALGASGCILWMSYKINGEVPVFDADAGWVKGVVRFVREEEAAKRREVARAEAAKAAKSVGARSAFAPAARNDPLPAVQVAPVGVVPAAEVPALMAGRWRIVENGATTGFVVLEQMGTSRVYSAFGPSGAKAPGGGSWRVALDGEVTLVASSGAGPETQCVRLVLSAGDRAGGFRWSRKDDSTPYRKGAAVEFAKEGK